MTYEVITDPYCTGDKWYKQYELVEEDGDSEEIHQYLLANYGVVPTKLQYSVDGEDGEVSFEIYPRDMLSQAQIDEIEKED